MDVLLPKSGSYIVAVSGGVDSMALLHLLQRQAGLDLWVAHFDHGIRPDSIEGRKLVQKIAKNYGLPFTYKEAHLGAGTSEAVARQARYDFLRSVQQAKGAWAIVTAHHQDDVLETIIINLLRGTGRKGLTSLRSRDDLLRPLLNASKAELLAYARENGLQWREDTTNQDTTYLRNYIRHKLLPRFSEADIAELVTIVTKSTVTNQTMDKLLADLLKSSKAKQLDREWFNGLPHGVAREVMAAWLRSNDLRDFDRKTLERLVVAAKVAQPDKEFPVLGGRKMIVSDNSLALAGLER